MVQCHKAALKLFIAYQQFAKAVEPTVRHFNNPAPGSFAGVTSQLPGFLAAPFDMGNVAPRNNLGQSRRSGVARIRTEVPGAAFRRLWSFDLDSVQYGLQLRDIMPVRSGHDE